MTYCRFKKQYNYIVLGRRGVWVGRKRCRGQLQWPHPWRGLGRRAWTHSRQQKERQRVVSRQVFVRGACQERGRGGRWCWHWWHLNDIIMDIHCIRNTQSFYSESLLLICLNESLYLRWLSMMDELRCGTLYLLLLHPRPIHSEQSLCTFFHLLYSIF